MLTARPKILFVVNSDWFFVSHRLPLARALLEAGCDVVVAAGETNARATIESAGLRFIAVPFDRGGRSFFRDSRTLYALRILYQNERPDLVHHVTIKPVLYGSLVAKALGIPAVVNAVSGLGFMFIDRPKESLTHQLLRTAIKATYRIALSGPRTRTIFQNPDDRDRFVRSSLVQAKNTALILGAGVDTERFHSCDLPDGPPLVLLPGRMLWDKGVGEFVQAARKLQGKGIRFVLVGPVDRGNPTAIPEEQLRAWQQEKIIEWWGKQTDMPKVLAQAHLVVLPSYGEGLPLGLIEAAACARACITTDIPGCREVVHHGENGWLIPVRDPQAVTHTIEQALADRSELIRRGQRGRARVERNFAISHVIAHTFSVYSELLANRWPTTPLNLILY